jgi:hypothetical protein
MTEPPGAGVVAALALAPVIAMLTMAIPRGAEAAPGDAGADPRLAVSLDEARQLLFAGEMPAACAGMQAAAVSAEQVQRAAIECLLSEKYRRDAEARDLALAIYRTTGSVAGLGEAETMDGGYRGTIKLVPQLPTGAYRQHLRWVAQATRDFDELFAWLVDPTPASRSARAARPGAPPSAASAVAPSFRLHGLSLRFVRSVAKRTPSAYALGWAVTYNVRGSLLKNAAGVAETLFHELFHLNDGARDDWSARTLATDYAAILARCQPRLTRACLQPYAPGTTTVRGGTYYAFQQNNGDSVHEYAAELALRYYKEHRELAATGTLSRPAFKCGAAENARAWRALVDEFFAGVDRTGECK